MRNLFNTRVKVILVIAALLTAGLAILSGITNVTVPDLIVQGILAPFRAAGDGPDHHGGKILWLYVPI